MQNETEKENREGKLPSLLLLDPCLSRKLLNHPPMIKCHRKGSPEPKSLLISRAAGAPQCHPQSLPSAGWSCQSPQQSLFLMAPSHRLQGSGFPSLFPAPARCAGTQTPGKKSGVQPQGQPRNTSRIPPDETATVRCATRKPVASTTLEGK